MQFHLGKNTFLAYNLNNQLIYIVIKSLDDSIIVQSSIQLLLEFTDPILSLKFVVPVFIFSPTALGTRLYCIVGEENFLPLQELIQENSQPHQLAWTTSTKSRFKMGKRYY